MTSDWKISLTNGGRLLNTGSVVSNDGRHYIILFSYQIKVYFLSSRQCIRSISLDSRNVIDSIIDPENANQVLLFRSTGEITVVNWKDKLVDAVVSTHQVRTELPLLKVVSVDSNRIIIITGKKENKYAPHTRTLVKLSRSDFVSEELISIKNVLKFNISLNKNKIVFVESNHTITLVDISNINSINKETIPFNVKASITALAISNDNLIAVGTSNGPIQLIYGTNEKQPRLLKWHIDQVRSLSFSEDSSYLLSGGLEKVLVFWQLETDKTQFLPRLNGTIDDIKVESSDYYSILLNLNENQDLEYLVLSSVDLVSRLSVSSIRPNFANKIQSFEKDKKKLLKNKFNSFEPTKIKHDYTSSFEIHPITKQLYFYQGAYIQAYDYFKGEQAFTQTAAPLLQTGKVRSETKLLDPSISLLGFTSDGTWMCTFESTPTSDVDNLLSKNDIEYALKFWKFIENTSNNKQQGHWELCTKIVDPHGFQTPIISLIQAPSSYFKGLAFLTADSKGGVRLWRPRIPKEVYKAVGISTGNEKLQQTAWTLRKSRPAGSFVSTAVALTWSNDSSVVFLGHETSIIPIDVNSFRDLKQLPSLIGSRIRSLSIVDNNLIALSKNRIVSFNLLSGKTNKLVAKVNTPIGGKNLIAIDSINNLICIGINFYTDDYELNSKVFLFKPDSLKPVYIGTHPQAISSIRYSSPTNSFLFVDLDSRIGSLTSSGSSLEQGKIEEEENFANEMNIMLTKAQQTAALMAKNKASAQAVVLDNDDEGEFRKIVNLNTFEGVFDNVENIQLESLFDRIMKVIN